MRFSARLHGSRWIVANFISQTPERKANFNAAWWYTIHYLLRPISCFSHVIMILSWESEKFSLECQTFSLWFFKWFHSALILVAQCYRHWHPNDGIGNAVGILPGIIHNNFCCMSYSYLLLYLCQPKVKFSSEQALKKWIQATYIPPTF